jgi:hypothetical protein
MQVPVSLVPCLSCLSWDALSLCAAGVNGVFLGRDVVEAASACRAELGQLQKEEEQRPPCIRAPTSVTCLAAAATTAGKAIKVALTEVGGVGSTA